MSLRPLNCELQKIAAEELHEDPKRIQETLEYLRTWAEKQPHLTIKTDDQTLINFVRGSKWNIERAKEKIDNYYSVRTLIPELFHNRDPFSPEIQKVLKAGIFLPLPQKRPGGPTIFFIKFSNVDVHETPAMAFLKVVLMCLDILIHEDDNVIVSGVQMFADYKGVPLNYMSQVTPTYARACLLCLQNAYPSRFNKYIGINVPNIFEKLLNSLLSIFGKKIKEKFIFFNTNSMNKMANGTDKDLLPQELGGKNGSLSKIAEQWKYKMESYRDWFLEEAKYCSNEHLRVGKSKYDEDIFGVDGTFRKITID